MIDKKTIINLYNITAISSLSFEEFAIGSSIIQKNRITGKVQKITTPAKYPSWKHASYLGDFNGKFRLTNAIVNINNMMKFPSSSNLNLDSQDMIARIHNTIINQKIDLGDLTGILITEFGILSKDITGVEHITNDFLRDRNNIGKKFNDYKAFNDILFQGKIYYR